MSAVDGPTPPSDAHAEPAPGSPDGPPPAAPFLVVGVGASAGGLEAFRELLEALPPDPGMAFLFVQHLEPSQRSLLQDILSKVTPLAVEEAVAGRRLEANHVYIIPPDADMAVNDGELTLSPRPARRAPHMPIDYLFRSLADNQKNRAVAVVLSGGGTDGALGFQAIKAAGGITIAQDEKSARHTSMPRSAVADGHADYVLAPREIAHTLARIARHPYPAQPDAAPAADADGLKEILGLLRTNTGVDFHQYKQSTILRRIRRRMALRGLDAFPDYLRLLRDDAAEVRCLYQDFLIRVTSFFRDEEVFEALKQAVFPHLVRDRSDGFPVRVWVAGCSTGEEVYSLAISLLEFLGERILHCPVKILATDVNEAALDKARAGVYLDNIELDVSAERLRRFFAKTNGHYQIGKAVRDLCVFSRHNLASDPPFSHLDLVSCRNVLIYLDLALQKRVVPILHYALNPGGYLVLGSSETVGPFTDLFNVVDHKHRVYFKNPVKAHAGVPLDFGPYVGVPVPEAGRPAAAAGTVSWSATDVQKEADRVVLTRYAPVGVVIDENNTVLQFRGRTGPYLEPAPGMASLDLFKMLREGLLGEVRSALTRAKADNGPVRVEGIALRERDQARLVSLEVMPIRVPPSGVRCFLVLFQEAAPPAAPAAKGAPAAGLPRVDQQVAQLQQELAATREYLQSLVEEHESACEELKSACEELLSANEELQSTNEELQTAKEETQSANEELATLNDELQHRNVELAQVNNDLVNLLAAINISIVLVSRDLRVRRFTPVAEKVLNLIPTDLGRPITDIQPNIAVQDLGDRIARVIDTLTPEEEEIQDKQGRWYSLRIRPYVTLDNKIEGASVTLLDIDSIKRGK